MKHAALAKRASDENGGPTALARKVGCSPSFVSQWIPKEHAPAVERVSTVTRKQLYPEDWHVMWPELAAQPQATHELAQPSTPTKEVGHG
ncbi:transcriptional regulator [Comamonas sp.]|uniref:transcriptional regulator n=1 Tax=Comamonas sp. TaxID=34028 RepID=UPI003A91F42B